VNGSVAQHHSRLSENELGDVDRADHFLALLEKPDLEGHKHEEPE
jgi:hypothetical protein